MLVELFWHPQALEDLIEIYVAVGLGSGAAAERIYSAIEARVAVPAEFPRLGVRRPEIASSSRVLVEGRCLVLYELHPDSDEGPVERVEIVRVVDGRRELSRAFN